MQHYMEAYAAQNLDRLLNPPDAPLKERLMAYFSGIIDVICDCESPKGCMFVKSSCESGGVGVPAEIESSLTEMAQANEMALSRLFEAEIQSGSLPEDTRVQDLTGYLLSMTYGLTIMARRGKTKEELTAVADMAVSTLSGIG